MAIFNFGPWETKGLPVLDSALPADVTVEATKSATFEVKITKDGNPKEYTYQWYYDGKAVSGATSASYTRTTTKSDGGNHLVHCTVTNKAGTITSRTANMSVDDSAYRVPQFTYTGEYKLVNNNFKTIEQGSLTDNWNLLLTSSGVLTFTNLGNAVNGVDVCLVGGGGSGGYGQASGGGGGGGGYTKNVANYNLKNNNRYSFIIGGSDGDTTGFGYTAKSGVAGESATSVPGYGSDGGSGGGYGDAGSGGSDGSDGGKSPQGVGVVGKGQGTTTRLFGDWILVAGGGGGWNGAGGAGGGGAGAYDYTKASDGEDMYGGGGGGAGVYGGYYYGGRGGSGCIAIRNKR